MKATAQSGVTNDAIDATIMPSSPQPRFIAPMILLTRRPSATMRDAELTFMGRAPIDLELARKQHAAYRTAVGAVTRAAIDLPALDAHPDATFVEDALLAFPEVFVLCRPGAVSRQGEVASIAEELPNDRPFVHTREPATIDGGDVLVIDRTVFVGLSTRTNREAVDTLEAALSGFDYRVVAVPVPGALHLKTAITSPCPGLVLMNPEWVDSTGFKDFDRIEVAKDEPFAGNCLVVGSSVFVQTAHRKTAERLDRHGIRTTPIDISEFAKAEAGLTCMSVLIPDAVNRPV